jgi:flavin reductase (DIM6/NTAB) family NADH-FMN oxidoreductase RutF
MTHASMPDSNVSARSWGRTDMEARTLRDMLGSYPTGVAIVTTRSPHGKPVGLTINSFASLSLSPPLVLWSLVSNSSNLEVFRHCSHFVINILAHDQETLAKQFATSALPDKFQGVNIEETPEGFPAIADALTTLVCANDHCREVGDHLLLVGKVVRSSHKPDKPLVFHGGKFKALAEVM